MQILTGACLCGAIRYRCGPPRYPATLCHCRSCQRSSGAPAVAWLTVGTAEFSFLSATPSTFGSSPGVERAFCGRCGTPLTYATTARPGEIDITLCSLDDPAAVIPADHIWMQDAAPWDRPGDGLVQHAGLRED